MRLTHLTSMCDFFSDGPMGSFWEFSKNQVLDRKSVFGSRREPLGAVGSRWDAVGSRWDAVVEVVRVVDVAFRHPSACVGAACSRPWVGPKPSCYPVDPELETRRESRLNTGLTRTVFPLPE